jgi:hypothetical protein
VAESWTTDATQCNSFGFAFVDVEAKSLTMSSWTGLASPVRFAQDGMAVSYAKKSLTVRHHC